MLTIRPFRNSDPPLLLALWTQSRNRDSRAELIPLSEKIIQMQTLGPPFFDRRSIMLAFQDRQPVGYVHATLGPSSDGSDLDHQTGQICFVAVDPSVAPEVADSVSVTKALLQAAETYLIGLGCKEIFGGSPRPCAPFYTGFFGGAEPIGFFDSDVPLIQAFRESGYSVVKNTVRFHLDLHDFEPRVTMSSVEQMDKLDIVINRSPKPKTWWEACSFAHFAWLEVAAQLRSSGRTVARIRVRITKPDQEAKDAMRKTNCDAGLMDVRVLPDFHRQGVAAYTMGELLRHLARYCNVGQIEAHIADDTPTMFSLLRSLNWHEIDQGKVFRKMI